MNGYDADRAFIRMARGFTRRGILARAGVAAAAVAASTLGRLGVPIPPASAQPGGCSVCTGPCSGCYSNTVPNPCPSPDGTCYEGSVACFCTSWEFFQPCYPPRVFAYIYSCSYCAPPSGSNGCAPC